MLRNALNVGTRTLAASAIPKSRLIASSRQFHITAASNDFTSWFKQLSSLKKEKEEAAKPQVSNEELMKQLEGTSSEDDESIVKKAVNQVENGQVMELEVIGLKDTSNIPETPEFVITKWKGSEKIQTKEELESVLKSAFQEIYGEDAQNIDDFVFEDLQKFFLYAKKVQQASGYDIPDLELTKMKNVRQMRQYFLYKALSLKGYNEKTPDAIYLDPKEFEGTNVYIVPEPTKKPIQKMYREAISD